MASVLPEGQEDSASLELSYAVVADEGDVVAEAALNKAFRFILATSAIATLLWLCRMCWIYLDAAYGWHALLGLLYPNLIGVAFALAGLRALRARSNWIVPLFWVAFFLSFAMPLSVFGWGGLFSDRLVQFAYNLGSACPLALILILYPLLRGKPTEVWIRRLTWFSIALLVLQLSDWLSWAVRWFIVRTRGQGAYPLFPVPLPEVGCLFAAALLYAFRRRLSRVILCTVAGYYFWYTTRILEFPEAINPFYASAYEYLTHQYFHQVANFLKALAAGLPLWMLVWFAFRFDRSQRRTLASAPALSQAPELAQDAANA